MDELVRFPSPSVWDYPVYGGPGAWYPAEANVPPVWEGGGPAHVPPEPKEVMTECPPPIITSIETWETWEEAWFPSSPRSFAKAARAEGWEARIGFSRGYVQVSKDSWEIRDVIGVWLDGYGRRAVAYWERNPEAEFSARKLEAGIKPGEVPSGQQWKTSGTAIMSGKGRSFGYANVTELKEWLALHGAALPSWYEAIKTKVQTAEAEAERKSKAKAKAGADALEQAAHEAAISDKVG